jgi:hypothetical protein
MELQVAQIEARRIVDNRPKTFFMERGRRRRVVHVGYRACTGFTLPVSARGKDLFEFCSPCSCFNDKLLGLGISLKIALQSIPEERTLVAHHQHLLIRVPRPNRLRAVLLNHLVPLPILPRIRPAQNKRHSNSSNTHSQTGCETGCILRLLARKVDITAHDTTHIAHGNEQCHADSTLRAGSQRIGYPRHKAGEGAVQARRYGEEEAISDAWILWVRDGELRDEAYDGDAVAADDPERAHLGQVGAPGPYEGDDCGKDVDRDC